MASWRRPLRSLHRDVGYLCAGLVLVYAVSGIAVNHRQHWDPDFVEERTTTRVGSPAELLGRQSARDPGALARAEQAALVKALLARLKRQEQPRTVFWRGADRLSLFFGDKGRDVIDYHPRRGVAMTQHRRSRAVFRQLNALHLNEQRTVWTWFADGLAVALLFLSVSGALIVRGRKGLSGRGKWLLLAGIAIPILALLLLG
ncbi:MAG: hypothetical protein CSA65_02130 [Proteobacteria bacterium]|nr:MAG: hypothetical protein CSA65_02130 [Pseudomonadota bacterium]